jgi:cell pole-organizing protein PopZ
MSQTAKAQEPSMEEILASIRRIIADDDGSKAVSRAPESAPAPKPQRPAVVAAPEPTPWPKAAQRVQAPPAPIHTQDEIDAVLADALPEPPVPMKTVPPEPPAADVLDLTEDMAASTFRTIDGGSDVFFAERSPEQAEPPRPAPAPEMPAVDKGLISSTTRAAVDSAFHSLANTMLGQNARTLEDLVKEMLRPMLRSWLDDNLPGMVERLVRAEIERVSRGR